MADRWLYRSGQFFQTINPVISAKSLEKASNILTPSQMDLFLRMQKSEQAHSLRVFGDLNIQSETDQDLLAAALLHDVGKICQPLHVWERVVIVLMQAIFPHTARRWGASSEGTEQPYPFWRRAFVVASQHPRWGADLALEAGVTTLTANLIRRHQEPLSLKPTGTATWEDQLLWKLKAVDDHR